MACDSATATGNNHIASNQLAQIPIISPTDRLKEKIASYVDKLLLLKKQLASVKTDREKTALQRQIDVTDRQIDSWCMSCTV